MCKEIFMKYLDVVTAILILVGGLNWGFVGFFEMDVVASMFSKMSGFTRFIYCLIGLSAVYRVLQWKCIMKRCKK